MQWNELSDLKTIDQIKEESAQQPILIFKHSTSCSISRASLGRLERNWKQEQVSSLKPYFLDLLSFRAISNKIASEFDVEHQSPQVLIIHKGKVVFDVSHYEIDFQEIKAQVLEE